MRPIVAARTRSVNGVRPSVSAWLAEYCDPKLRRSAMISDCAHAKGPLSDGKIRYSRPVRVSDHGDKNRCILPMLDDLFEPLELNDQRKIWLFTRRLTA